MRRLQAMCCRICTIFQKVRRGPAVCWKATILVKRHVPATGLFTASGHFDTPLISVVDGPILKPFGVVIVITGWFGLVYNNAWQVVRYLCKYWISFGPILQQMKFPGKSEFYLHWIIKNIKTSDVKMWIWMWKKRPVKWRPGPSLVIWWTWSHFVDVWFSSISRKFRKFKNWSRIYAIFPEVPGLLASIVIHQTKPNSSDSGTSWKSYLTPNCSLSPNFTGPCASKILIVWWLLMKEMWPAGHNYDLLVTSETSWLLKKVVWPNSHTWQQLVTPWNS